MSAFASARTRSVQFRHRRVRELLARALERIFRIPILWLAARALRRRVRTVSSVDDALELAYEFSFGGIVFGPWQEPSEIRSLMHMVEAIRPQTVLEIGTSNGGTLFLFARVALPDALIVSVDLPRGQFGGGYPRWRAPLYQAFAADKQTIRLLRADSHAPETLEKVRAALNGRKVDVLFIDGDHTYDGVRQDFEMYGPLVREGGLVAFHDIVPPRPNGPLPWKNEDLQGGEVSRFWAELRSSREVSEFVENWDSGRFGIGVITVGRGARTR
jgi:cephalosporin hydroxylase